MNGYTLVLSRRFQKLLLKYLVKNQKLKQKVSRILDLIQTNPRHPSLRLHKLNGVGRWSISVDMSIRMIIQIEGDKIYLLDLGNHDQVY